MIINLKEFRKSLPQPIDSAPKEESQPSEFPANAESLSASPVPTPIADLVPGEPESIAVAVRKFFAPFGTLQGYTDEFAQATQQLDQLRKKVARILGPLRGIHNQMFEVAGSFGSLCSLQAELATLSKDSEPMGVLHDQVKQLTGTIELELGQVVKALNPVNDLNAKVRTLGYLLSQVNGLHADLANLHAALGNNGLAAGATREEVPGESATMH